MVLRPIACAHVSESEARPARYQVVGIGNELVDVIAHADDTFLGEHHLVKGSMALVDTERALELYRALGSAVEMSGGSAANTMCGIASFGGRAAYIGKVSDDELGEVFGHDLLAVGVAFRPGAPSPVTPTGRCIIVVTPDAQRTMNTYLGVSSLLAAADIDEEAVADGEVLYMEGYLFDRDDANAAFRRAAEVAHEHERRVSLTLSDSFCVDRHRDDFVCSFASRSTCSSGTRPSCCRSTSSDDLDAAIEAVRRDLRAGGDHVRRSGCIVVTADEVIAVPAESVDRVLDTTGAGDLFAAGFLHGLTTGATLAECARLGSIAAAEVIAHVGPRPLVELRTLAP